MASPDLPAGCSTSKRCGWHRFRSSRPRRRAGSACSACWSGAPALGRRAGRWSVSPWRAGGLVLLGLALVGTHTGHARASAAALIVWLAASALAAAVAVALKPRFLGSARSSTWRRASSTRAATSERRPRSRAAPPSVSSRSPGVPRLGVLFPAARLPSRRRAGDGGSREPADQRASDRSRNDDLPRGCARGLGRDGARRRVRRGRDRCGDPCKARAGDFPASATPRRRWPRRPIRVMCKSSARREY